MSEPTKWRIPFSAGVKLQAELDAAIFKTERLRLALLKAADQLETGYWSTRAFIDENVPDWVRGDDGPSYPMLKAAAEIRRFLAEEGE